MATNLAFQFTITRHQICLTDIKARDLRTKVEQTVHMSARKQDRKPSLTQEGQEIESIVDLLEPKSDREEVARVQTLRKKRW